MDKTPGQILFERRYSEGGKSHAWRYLDPSRQRFYEECVVIFVECAPKPEIYVTAERPPEEGDALAVKSFDIRTADSRFVLAWTGRVWRAETYELVKDNPKTYTHWQRQPPAPVSEDDRALEKAKVQAHTFSMREQQDKHLFNAALAHARGQKGEL